MIKTFRKNSQCQKILNYLKEGNTITVEQCRSLGWGSNCRSRISDLIEAGYIIKSKMIKFSGGYVAQYELEKG